MGLFDSLLPKVPHDPNPAATYTETPERERLRQILGQVFQTIQLPPPLLQLFDNYLSQLSDGQLVDAVQHFNRIGYFLATGEMIAPGSPPAESLEQLESAATLPPKLRLLGR